MVFSDAKAPRATGPGLQDPACSTQRALTGPLVSMSDGGQHRQGLYFSKEARNPDLYVKSYTSKIVIINSHFY